MSNLALPDAVRCHFDSPPIDAANIPLEFANSAAPVLGRRANKAQVRTPPAHTSPEPAPAKRMKQNRRCAEVSSTRLVAIVRPLPTRAEPHRIAWTAIDPVNRSHSEDAHEDITVQRSDIETW